MYELIDIKEVLTKKKMQQIFTFIAHAFEKIGEAIQYPITWIASFFLFVVEAVTGGKFIIYIVLVASIIDLICGISVARHNGRFTQSELLRQTVEKLVVYGLALLVFLCVDFVIKKETGFSVEISSGLVGILITLTETWSFLASLLILYPNNPFLKFMQKALTGELSRKLGCDEKKVSMLLNASRKKKSVKRDPKGRFIKK